MFSIKSTFASAASGRTGFSLVWLAIFAIAILNDEDRRDKKRRKKRERAAAQAPAAKPPSGPRPF